MMVAEPVERGRVVFEYLIGDSSGISRVSETHEMGWFTHLEYISAFKKAGLKTEHIQPGITDRVCSLHLTHHVPHQFHGHFSTEVFMAPDALRDAPDRRHQAPPTA